MLAHDALLAHGRSLLETARADRATWDRLAPERAQDEAGNVVDRRELDRLQLAWALEHAFTPDDAELVRAVFAHEVEWREVAPFQGIGDTLEILGGFIAGARRVEDVWLLGRAKLANFDCSCGFDLQHLVTGGVAATIEHLRQSGRPAEERDDLLRRLVGEDGAPLLDDEEVAGWLAIKERRHPRPEDEPIEVWIHRALELGQHDLARQLVAEWSACGERDAEFLRALAGYHRDLAEYAEEATVRDELLLALSTPWDRASQRVDAAIAARRAGQWARALEHLDHAALLHRPRKNWRELGLGRQLLHQMYELAASAPEPIAGQALVLAEEFDPSTSDMHAAGLEQKALALARNLSK